jgi:hypothetical protein
MPMSRMVREHLEDAKFRQGKQRFLRHIVGNQGVPSGFVFPQGFSDG